MEVKKNYDKKILEIKNNTYKIKKVFFKRLSAIT